VSGAGAGGRSAPLAGGISARLKGRRGILPVHHRPRMRNMPATE